MSLQLPPFTPADAAQRLQDDGLRAMGIAAPLIAMSWSNADVTLDEAALTLTATDEVRAPFLGIRSWSSDVSKMGLYDATGTPLTGTAAIFRLHPAAAQRFHRLANSALGPAAGSIRPLPETMVVRAFGTAPTLTTPAWFPPDTLVADDGRFSFHDGRGQIIDPIAVAELLQQLLSSFIGLQPAGAGTAPGGLAHIADKGLPGVVIQIVDPHGNVFEGVDGVVPQLVDAGGAVVGPAPLGAPTILPAGQRVGPPTTGAGATRLRVGWWRNGTMGRVPLDVPPLNTGVTLRRQFLRICAVDLDWHLLGNRSTSARLDVPPDDGATPAEFRPVVRDRVRLDYLVDGVDTLGATGQVLGPMFAGAGFTGLVAVASPAFEPGVGLPPGPGPAGHWPTFPPPPAIGPAPTGAPTTGLTAVWSGAQDVVLTFPGGTIAVGSHVRVYPQVFQLILSIGPAPSFLRGDGGATLVTAPGPFSILLRDPLNLPDGSSQPAGSGLIFDLVIADRSGAMSMTGNVNVPITADPAPAVADPFATPDLLAPVPDNVKSVAPSPVFGIPLGAPTATGSPPGSIVDLIRRLASETLPRIGPRLPTMARFPTLVAVGTGPTTAPLAWEAVVSGGRLSRETRSADHARGNPGNPAGPDVQAAGVHVDGAAAFDIAQIALRRAQPLLPMGGGTSGWVPFVANAGWVAPAEPATDAAPAGQAPRTTAAAVLRTVAIGCETPELTLPGIPMPSPTASVQNLVNDLAAALGVSPPTVTITNEAQIVREIRREFQWSRFGARDAQWALRRAVHQARDLLLIVSPQFARTAQPPPGGGAAAAHEVDLVDELVDRMTAHRSLRVLIALPRWPDAALAYGGWVRQSFEARNEAVAALRAVDATRVAVFHPAGFPGRAAAIRTTTVIADDAWAIVGTSHWRRRGMTFDEGVDVVGIDRALDGGSSGTRVRRYRQALLMALTSATAPSAGAAADDAVQFAGLRSSFDFAAELIAQGGLGRLSPFWAGPQDTDVISQSEAVADPDGGSSSQFLTLFAGLIGESSS